MEDYSNFRLRYSLTDENGNELRHVTFQPPWKPYQKAMIKAMLEPKTCAQSTSSTK